MASHNNFLDVYTDHQLGVSSGGLGAAVEVRGPDQRAGLPVPKPLPSFWLSDPDVVPPAIDHGQGDLPTDADVCIIGSGISGVSVAYHLATQATASPADTLSGPIRVVILEARDFCSGATGRNGGHLTPVRFEGFLRQVEEHGAEDALRGLALERHTVDAILEVLRTHGRENFVDLVSGGHTDMYFTEGELASAKADFAAAQEAGAPLDDVEWVSEDEIFQKYGARFPATRFAGHNLWPAKLVRVLYELACETTPRVAVSAHTRTPVIAINAIAGSGWSVETSRGTISCRNVVHTTNAYVSHLLPHLSGTDGVVPTRGHVIAFRASVPAEDIPKTSCCANYGFEYWFPRPVRAPQERPLIIAGGAREVAVPHFDIGVADDSLIDSEIALALCNFLPGVFPGKFDVVRTTNPEMIWTGIMGFTKSGDPFVGPVVDPANPDADTYKGQYLSVGFSGHGMPRAFGCAEAVAGMLIARLTGKRWDAPSWLPLHYLTRRP